MRADRAWPRLGLLAALAGLAVGCTDIENSMASVAFLNFMREAPSFDPYEAPRPAPPNSVPLESPAGPWEPSIPKPVSEAALRAFGDTMTNPLQSTEAVLERGQEVFLTYCSVCHGTQGAGNGPIVGPGKFPMGPDLTIPLTAGRSDGYIYAIIKAGRGLMPPYQRIPPRDRWAVVHYVRQLQGQTGTTSPATTPDTAAAAAPAIAPAVAPPGVDTAGAGAGPGDAAAGDTAAGAGNGGSE